MLPVPREYTGTPLVLCVTKQLFFLTNSSNILSWAISNSILSVVTWKHRKFLLRHLVIMFLWRWIISITIPLEVVMCSFPYFMYFNRLQQHQRGNWAVSTLTESASLALPAFIYYSVQTFQTRLQHPPNNLRSYVLMGLHELFWK